MNIRSEFPACILTVLCNIIFLIFSGLLSFAQVNPTAKNVNFSASIHSSWTFKYFPEGSSEKGFEVPGYNDSGWQVVSIPHTWMLYETTGDLFPFNGKKPDASKPYWLTGQGCYRKHFTINRELSERKFFLQFNGVKHNCKVWFNGKYLGETNSKKSPFCFDVTEFAKTGEDNLLAVSVTNPQAVHSSGSGNSDFFSGISDEIIFIARNKLMISLPAGGNQINGKAFSNPEFTFENGILKVSAWVRNEYTGKKEFILQTTLTDASGKVLQITKTSAAALSGQLLKIEQTGKQMKSLAERSNESCKARIEIIDNKIVIDTWTGESGTKTGKNENVTHEKDLEFFLAGIDESFKIKTSSPAAESGEPARIVLKSSPGNITACRSSLALITADIVDSRNNPVRNVAKNLRWSVSGPGTLAGPTIFESDPYGSPDDEKVWKGNLPVANLVRSSGEPGLIHLVVTAPGLVAGILDIPAIEVKPDNSIVTEPVLSDRMKSDMTKTMITDRLEDIPAEIKPVSSDISLKKNSQKEYEIALRELLKTNNPGLDTASVEIRILVKMIGNQLVNDNGRISFTDFNSNAENFNNCKLIAGYINATKLPVPFKEGLREYYSEKIIIQGKLMNAGDEMNWLNWMPSGGTVVYVWEGKPSAAQKGVVFTEKEDLESIISLVHPAFTRYNAEARERAFTFIAKMNPYVHTKESGSIVAEKGKPVLIPLIKFISE